MTKQEKLSEIKKIRADLLALEIKVLSEGRFPAPEPGFILEDFIQEVRNHYYVSAIQMAGGNATKAAALLGVTSAGVAKGLKKAGYVVG
jgi:hypothetical protein